MYFPNKEDFYEHVHCKIAECKIFDQKNAYNNYKYEDFKNT